jgi:hypothetical protein
MSENETDLADDCILDEQTFASNTCKGLFFRCKINNYWGSNRRIVNSVEMVPVRRMSCSGCVHCGHAWEAMGDDVDIFIVPTDVEHNGIYALNFVVDGTDWESGIVDDWHYEFAKVDGK